MAFRFLPERDVPIDYYGPHRVINTWESFGSNLSEVFEQLYGMPAIRWRINLETHEFWDFFMTFQQLPMPSNGMVFGLAGTPAMKKGKSLSSSQETALSTMGFFPPLPGEMTWNIELSEDERAADSLAKIVVHALDYGIGFNPNLFQSSEVVDVTVIDVQ